MEGTDWIPVRKRENRVRNIRNVRISSIKSAETRTEGRIVTVFTEDKAQILSQGGRVGVNKTTESRMVYRYQS